VRIYLHLFYMIDERPGPPPFPGSRAYIYVLVESSFHLHFRT
jgi:hypothetical protein